MRARWGNYKIDLDKGRVMKSKQKVDDRKKVEIESRLPFPLGRRASPTRADPTGSAVRYR